MARSVTVRRSPTEVAHIAGRLRISVARLNRYLRYQDQSGYGATVVATLATIDRHGPLTLGELANREQVAPPTITKVVEKLELAGLVARSGDPSDRRVTRVNITAKGGKELELYRNRRTAWLSSRLSELSADELARLEAALPVLEHLLELPEDAS